MSIEIKLGERSYIFYNYKTINRAREVWENFKGTQDQFEQKLEDEGIEYNHNYKN